jgi:hypothetical protein
VAEADAQQRNPAFRAGRNHLDRYAGGLGLTGARRNHHPSGISIEQLINLHDIVSNDLDLGAEFTQVLDQIEGEGIVIIDHQEMHRRFFAPAG